MNTDGCAKKTMILPFVGLAASSRGNVTITTALFIPVLVGTMAFNMELISYDRGQTRMHQAQMAGALAAGKEGQPEDGTSTDLQAIIDKYMAVNMGALGTEEQWHFANIGAPLTSADGDGGYAVTAAAEYDSWFSPVGDLVLPPVHQVVRTERYYRKMETVLVLDASSSISDSVNGLKPIDSIRQGVIDYIDAGFHGGGHKISLLAYSGYVTLNLKYKDKLATIASRQWKARYPELQTVADEYGWGGIDDFLNGNGPERIRQGLPLDRRNIFKEFGGDPVSYVEAADHPPADEGEKFPALISHLKVDGPSFLINLLMLCNATGNPAVIPAIIGFQIPSGDRDAKAPNEDYECRRHILDRCICIFTKAPVMPTVLHSTNREELLQHLELYLPNWFTGSDEGIMWALRILSPNWADIWEIDDEDGDAIPAPYHGDVDKRIVLITDGADTIGHYKNNSEWRDIFPALGDYIKKRNIDFYFIYFSLYKTKRIFPGTNVKHIVALDDPEHVVFFPDGGESAAKGIVEFLTKLGKRQYRVRLAG